MRHYAEAYLTSLEKPVELKARLYEYLSFNHFDYEVHKLVDEGVVEERAVEIVLGKYLKEIEAK